MQKKLWLSIVTAMIGVGLLVAASFAGSASSASHSKGSASKVGGTLRVNLSTTDLEYTDPALEYESTGWQVEYATALKLLNWKETKAQLFNEAASRFTVAPSGKRYTFTIRPGLKLSNGEAVTAANFKLAFTRATSAKMNSPAAAFLSDLGSVIAKGKYTLIINLKNPRPDFASIVSMPFFQAISKKTPIDPNGVKTPASGGPYYISSRDVGRSVVLSRNKYYKGTRPHNPNSITISVNTNLDTSLLQVKANQKDYDMFGVPPTAHVDLHNKYPKQYHVSPGVVTDYVTMNTTYGSKGEGIKNHSCFNGNTGVGVRTRQAVNYVVNRPAALAQRGAFAGTPTDQVLPPTMPGFKNWKLYPTGKPNVAKANSLKPKKCGSTVFYGSTSPVSIAIMQLVKNDLSKIGISTTLKTFPFAVRIAKEGHRGEPFDLDLQAWGADYPDPVDFIDILLDGRNIQAENNNNNAYFNHVGFNARMTAAGRISNLPKRYAAWALLDRDIMKNQAPLAPLFFRTVREFTSKRIGCWSYQPIYGSMNLSAVCIG
ncbi:MAG: peptide/nickel transport system substrate-binding protein [Gaiellaceae bacterium]|jgi:ABC-type transport system substrate-binding protein|nr:peptide/nickel transport system substrate-binding protein [Gaiellaceae bacterium]